jgi:uncharacterized SAM-binding protein YcdF (DUF218 family)
MTGDDRADARPTSTLRDPGLGSVVPAGDPTPVATPRVEVPVHSAAGVASGAARRPRWGRRVALGLLAILAALALYYLVTLAQVWSTGRADDTGPVDAIVVMGAAQYDGRPSPLLQARLDHVLEIWPNIDVPMVVVTGGNIPGDRFTEADASAAYLAERGIPESALLMEDTGSTTYQSLDNVADLLTERGLDSVLIVTDPYHALRSKLIAEEVGLDASVSSTNTSVVTGGESLRRHLEEAAGISVGRVIGFERLTDLVD